jgi:hypothetical protein
MTNPTNVELAEAFIKVREELESAKSMGHLRELAVGSAAVILATDLPERLIAAERENERLRKRLNALECPLCGDDPYYCDCASLGEAIRESGV